MINFGKICGEAKSALMADIMTWMSEKWPIIRKRYRKDDIYNADETGILYNITPLQNFLLKCEKCVRGKLFKNQLRDLACSILSGTDKKKLWLLASPKTLDVLSMQKSFLLIKTTAGMSG